MFDLRRFGSTVMKFQKLTTVSLLFLTFLVNFGSAAQKSQLESMYDKAFQAFDNGKYDEALTALDTIDAQQPDQAESHNLRGVIYMRQGQYDKAEKTLRKVLAIEPRFWNASFNLAEIPFLKKDWSESRNRFEALLAGEHNRLQPETNQLIQYKILLTFILEGKENMVDWILSKFELSKDSPVLYYSNAGIAFQHGNQKEAEKWIDAADTHFPAPLNKLYAESLYEVGWLQRPPGESHPTIETTSAAERAAQLKAGAQVNFEKAERAFRQRDFDSALKLLDGAEAVVPDDAVTNSRAKEQPLAPRLGRTESLPVPVEAKQTAPAANPAATASKALPSASPALAGALTAPVVPHAPAASIVTVQASAIPVAATGKTAASPAATKPNPVQARAWSQTFVDLINRIPRPRAGALLVGCLLLAGILLFAWFFMRQVRRMATGSADQSSAAFSAPRFLDEEMPLRDQPEGAAELVETGPPKLSLNSKVRESVVGAAVLPAGASSTQDALSVSGTAKPPTASPNESKAAEHPATLVPEEKDPAAAEEPLLYTTEEVLLPASAETGVVQAAALANPTAEKPKAATPAPDERDVSHESALAPHVGDEKGSLELAEESDASSVEPTWEPVGQGQPIPELVAALAAEPVISELTQAEPKTKLALIEPDGPIAAPIAGRQAIQSSIEVPSFASKVISTGSTSLLYDTPPARPEIETAPAVHHFAPSALVQGPTEAGHATVQLTFSLEIASMQLTSTLKMSRLHLKPISRVVSVRLGSAQDPEATTNHKVAFEITKIGLSNGTIGSVRLVPSTLQGPAAAVHPSLAISSLELVPGQEADPVQLIPSHQEQASVQLTAEFRIGEVEFAPLFKIAAIVLDASSRKVSMRLLGAKSSSIDDSGGYEIENVQLGANDELALIQVARGRVH
jgi:tetratricopeptide (TPR) repeat protein